MSGLSQTEQLVLVEKLSSLSTDILTNKNENVSRFSRKGMTYHRIRIDDLRIYFEREWTCSSLPVHFGKKFFSGFYGPL